MHALPRYVLDVDVQPVVVLVERLAPPFFFFLLFTYASPRPPIAAADRLAVHTPHSELPLQGCHHLSCDREPSGLTNAMGTGALGLRSFFIL